MKAKFKILLGLAGAASIGLLAIQFVPVDYINPPIRGIPRWDSPRTEALARRACYDCHSNETRWPAYSRVAPLSWWIVAHVRDGRSHLNFSEPPYEEADEAAEELMEGEMPLRSYVLAHAEARLTPAETQQLAEGLRRTFGSD